MLFEISESLSVPNLYSSDSICDVIKLILSLRVSCLANGNLGSLTTVFPPRYNKCVDLRLFFTLLKRSEDLIDALASLKSISSNKARSSFT